MPRQVSRTRNIIRNGMSSVSQGTGIGSEIRNMKRSLLLKPSSHPPHNTMTWMSFVLVLFFFFAHSAVINTGGAILLDLTDSFSLSLYVLIPSLFKLGMAAMIILITGWIYKKVFRIDLLTACYFILLSYVPSIPLLLTERLFALILIKSFKAVHDYIFHIGTIIVMATVSQYIVRINITTKIDPPSSERSDFIRNLTLVLGQTISSVVFYILVMHPEACIKYQPLSYFK